MQRVVRKTKEKLTSATNEKTDYRVVVSVGSLFHLYRRVALLIPSALWFTPAPKENVGDGLRHQEFLAWGQISYQRSTTNAIIIGNNVTGCARRTRNDQLRFG